MRKGVSPLIATVLLIAFTVVLAAVVGKWLIEFAGEQTKQAEKTTSAALKCSGLRIDLSCDCKTGAVTVHNNGGIDFKSVIFRIYKGGIPIVDKDSGKTGVPAYVPKTFNLGQAVDAQKIEAIVTIPGESGAEDITCDQLIESCKTSC